MPVNTARTRDHDSTRPVATQHAVAHDDDRGAAHRASMAGLRREDAQLRGPSDHDRADVADFQALQVSLELAAVQLRRATHQIEDQIASPASGGAGIQPQLDVIRSIVDDSSQVVVRLNRQFGMLAEFDDHTSGGLTKLHAQLHPELCAVEQAFDGFRHAVDAANQYGASNKVTFPLGEATMHMAWLLDKLGLKAHQLTRPAPLARPEAAVLDDALASNVHAVIAGAHAVRGGLASGHDPVVATDLETMKRNLGAVAGLVGQLHDARALRHVKPSLRHLTHELDALERELAASPALDRVLRRGSYTQHRQTLANRIGA